MRGFVAALLLSAWCAVCFTATRNCDLADTYVESLIKSKAKELRCQEYCQFRLYDSLCDIDGDGKDDFVVVFTVEGPDGGNFHESYMYVFLTSAGSGKPLLAKVGERGDRDPESVSGERGKVVVTTRAYLPKDPQCCPSGHGKAAFLVKDGQLIEAKTKG